MSTKAAGRSHGTTRSVMVVVVVAVDAGERTRVLPSQSGKGKAFNNSPLRWNNRMFPKTDKAAPATKRLGALLTE